MQRFRKALMAGFGAAVAGLITALVNGDQPATPAGWASLIGGSVGLGVLAGVSTYAVRNTGPGIDPATGSEVPTPGFHRP